MEQSPRERIVGLPGGLHSPFTVTRVKITGEKFLPQTFKQDTILSVYLEDKVPRTTDLLTISF